MHQPDSVLFSNRGKKCLWKDSFGLCCLSSMSLVGLIMLSILALFFTLDIMLTQQIPCLEMAD